MQEKPNTEEMPVMPAGQLEDRLRLLRVKARLTKGLSVFCSVMSFLLWILQNVALFFLGLVATSVFAAMAAASSHELKRLLVRHIIQDALTEVLGEVVEYDPAGRLERGTMVFPFAYHMVSGSDHIKAVYKGLSVELSDIAIKSASKRNGSKEDFKGQWLICDFGRELACELRLFANDVEVRLRQKTGGVTTENEAFNARFLIAADNAQEAYYILTPHVMEYILAMADKSGGDVYLSFLREGKLQIAVNTGRDFLEPGKSRANTQELREKFLDELRWFADIIDTLRVEDTLYKLTDIRGTSDAGSQKTLEDSD